MHCEIISQDRLVFKGDVDIVNLPGVDGFMGILPHHSPLLTTLLFGVISLRKGQEEQYFTVAGGIAEVINNQVTILADAAEDVAELNEARAEAARARAEEMLSKVTTMDTDEFLSIQTSLKKSSLRLQAIKKHRARRGMQDYQ